MTGEEGSGAEPLCNLLSVLCQLVTETPDSFIKEASGVVYLHRKWREVIKTATDSGHCGIFQKIPPARMTDMRKVARSYCLLYSCNLPLACHCFLATG